MRSDLIISDMKTAHRNWTTATAPHHQAIKSRSAFVLTGKTLETQGKKLFSVFEFCGRPPSGAGPFRFLKEKPHGKQRREITRFYRGWSNS